MRAKPPHPRRVFMQQRPSPSSRYARHHDVRIDEFIEATAERDAAPRVVADFYRPIRNGR